MGASELPFAAVSCCRPGFIQPMKSARSTIGLTGAIYAVLGPMYPVLHMMPKYVTSTPERGRPMNELALRGGPKTTLENEGLDSPAERAAAGSR